MKARKGLSKALASVLSVTLMLGSVACGSSGAGESTDAPASSQPASSNAAAGDTSAAASSDTAAQGDATAQGSDLEPMTLEVYSQPANFHGEQTGWTAKILKDKFNVTLNIIAPQVAGGDIFAARSSAGFLGDIVVLDNTDIQDCVKAGLIYDFTDQMKTFTAFDEYKKQLDYYNSAIEGVSEGQYYAWPTEMTNTSPVSFSPTIPGVAPTVPWDYYKEVGEPEIHNLNDLIDCLKAMQEKHPTNADGDPSYGITLWPDWDGLGIENVNQLTKWYGQEMAGDGKTTILLDTQGNMTDLTDDTGAYKKILQFFFDANQAGIIDPDSGTQNWDSVNQKLMSKRAFLIWNDWQQGFWNSTARGEAGENYIMVPIDDMKLYQVSDPYYGSGRAFACGTDDPEKQERVRMVMDWMSSPEGMTSIDAGIEGLSYVIEADGTYDQTPWGETAIGENPPVPEEYGGGTYADGMLQINQWMLAAIAINPVTGITYDPRNWPTTVKKSENTTLLEWRDRFDAQNPVDYLTKNKLIQVVPYVNVSLAPDTSEISVTRASCKQLVNDASWKMIFAKDQAEFDQLWENLKTDLQGFGWDDLVKFDKEKFQALVDERAKALAANS
jgi:multiple sugar transport system substrate-binding protein/putative aldouronate transport system substrate-binding protein